MLPDENGMVGNGHNQNTCPGMTAWCLNWPNGTADWAHVKERRGLMTIAIDGTDSLGTAQGFIDYPANMTLHFGLCKKISGTETCYKVRYLSVIEQIVI